MIPDQYRDKIAKIKELYNTAEADLKNVGREKPAIVVTGINQCRYVGQHLLRALTASDENIDENLDAALRHAQRAIYDINDSGIQYYIEQIDEIRLKHFPTVDFSSAIKNYNEIIEEIGEARSLSETTAKSLESLENREQFYQDAREHVSKLRKYHQLLVEYRPDLVRAVKKENATKRNAWVGMALSLLSILAFIIIRLLQNP